MVKSDIIDRQIVEAMGSNPMEILFYRGPGFLAVVGFGSSPTPPPYLLSLSSTGYRQMKT
jgi:hypothetical protein